MKIKSIIPIACLLIMGLATITSCQKGDLIDNPNVANNNGSIIPLSLIVDELTSNMIKSSELPFGDANKYEQYDVANYSYYRGTNLYSVGFSNTIDSYDIFKYALALQQQSVAQLHSNSTVYYALGQFYKAYAGIWLAQRVGDIPFSSVNGSTTNLTPTYDKQHDVYNQCLNLLDSANNTINALYSSPNPLYKITPTGTISGDINGFTNTQWQKVINTYRLRVLISLSKAYARGATADFTLGDVKTQFAAIFNNQTQYPIMASNSDNLIGKFNAANNPYSLFVLGYNPYINFANVGEAYLNITTATQDPRTFLVATPAPNQVINNGLAVSNFSAYVGANMNVGQSTLLATSSAGTVAYSAGTLSFSNYTRYYTDKSGATQEPFIFIGYPELCFNIAEAMNRGWITGTTATWYTNGIKASLANYGLTDGQTIAINYPVKIGSNAQGAAWGTATAQVNAFLANVAYAGDNATGLTQILTQKYVAFNNNSGWEAYYNYRRTGIPTFDTGSNLGTSNNLIPNRFLYPQNEVSYNSANNGAAITSQGFGSDDITKNTWLTQ